MSYRPWGSTHARQLSVVFVTISSSLFPPALRRRLLAGAIASFGITFSALAQDPVPSTGSPAYVPERFESRPMPSNGKDLPALRGGAPAPLSDVIASVKVTLQEIRIEGATALPIEPWREQSVRYIGREISGREIFEIAHTLTIAYRNAGYILSQVVIPPQSLAQGVLTLRVIEGYIADVRVEGDPSVRETLVDIGEKIKASRPLHVDTLERYLLIARDLPGMQLRSVLSPSQTPGAADLTLIAEVRKLEGFASLDNYGSKYLGPGQFTISATGHQLTGTDDRLQFVGVTTGNTELGFGQLIYSQVINAEGLGVDISLLRARTQPGDALEPYDIHGRASSGTVTVNYPMWRSRNRSLFVRAAYDHRNVDIDVLGVPVIEDRIRAVRLGTTWLVLDSWDGNNRLDLELSQGIGGTDASDPRKSRVGADGTFNKLVLTYERYQPMGNYGIAMGAAGQWTDEPLLTAEQYALGGRRFGRAYEPAEVVGDRALAFGIEPSYSVRVGSDWLASYQLFGFYDIGIVRNEGPAVAGSKVSQSLASSGFGARFFVDRNVVATLEAAWPLTKPVASYDASGEGKDVRILGAITVRF